jgi:hypothetical protein
MDKLIFLFRRRDGLGRPEFFDHYVKDHSPLGMRLTKNLSGYTVNLVYTEGGPDAVTEIWTPSAADFLDPSKAFASPENQAEMIADHEWFIGSQDIYVVEEQQVVAGEALDTPLSTPTPEAKLVWLYGENDKVPEPPAGARRVIDHRVTQILLSEAPALAVIRMAWAADLDRFGTDRSDALVVREYRHRIPTMA